MAIVEAMAFKILQLSLNGSIYHLKLKNVEPV